jgi:hypothetical protein
MKYHLMLSRAQAGALARLIQAQIEAYDEADEPRRASCEPRKTLEPFTSADLDLIEPLLGLLQKLFAP